MRSILSSCGILAAVGLVSLVAAPGNAQTTVDYRNLGNATQSSPLDYGGITVTSDGTFTLSTATGLGILGGGRGFIGGPDEIIDSGESVLFTFANGPATHVSIRPRSGKNAGGGTATTLEAFGSGGGSLGVFDYFGGSDLGFFTNPDLSARVGGAAISAFRITGGSRTGGAVGAITYTSAAAVVPEPGEYAVMGMAGLTVCGLMIRARRRRQSLGLAG